MSTQGAKIAILANASSTAHRYAVDSSDVTQLSDCPATPGRGRAHRRQQLQDIAVRWTLHVDHHVDRNWSHSGHLSAVALADIPGFGFDIERIRTVPDHQAVVRRYFADSERSEIADQGDDSSVFLAAWTLREAVAKSSGQGIAQIVHLRIRTVSPRLYLVDDVSHSGKRWIARSLRFPGPGGDKGIIAAIAAPITS